MKAIFVFFRPENNKIKKHSDSRIFQTFRIIYFRVIGSFSGLWCQEMWSSKILQIYSLLSINWKKFVYSPTLVTTNVSHSRSEQLFEQNTISHSIDIENELEFMLSKCYFYSPLFSYERYKMLLKTALFNALYVKHLTYFLELAAAEYTTETAEGLKIWEGGEDCKKRSFNDTWKTFYF